ncbi:MAG TPA: hypothetical protein VFT22_44020 [Kofleriaceae bacterium]|nr:hypothetical protein [Kofleriaceae bacterium]
MIRLLKRVKRVLEIPTLLTISALLTLVGLALMVWSLLQPTPMPVILAMSLGQAFGIVAFALFGVAILIDQVRKQRAKGAAEVARAAAERTPVAAGASDELPALAATRAQGDGRTSSARPASSSSVTEAPR